MSEPVKSKAIASDGGSSTYYDINLPDWLIEKILARKQDGVSYVKTEELLEVAFGNDFDFSNILKSLVRAFGAFNGAGKLGNSVHYEANKIIYSAGKIKAREDRKHAN